MKNIHTLPTSLPSRLGYLTKKGKEVFKDLRLFDVFMPTILDGENQHIYITNSEEIKEGDWGYCKSRNKICKVTGISKWTHKDDYSIDLDNENYFIHHSYCKKIILTTDTDLIKDGIQAIDDEFLEWFVKNPSCENVEVTYGVLKPFKSEDKGYLIHCPDNEVLEEPKQETQGYVCPQTKMQCDDECCVNAKDCHIKASIGVLSEPKQETLEEAKLRQLFKNRSNCYADADDVVQAMDENCFIETIKEWQQERMYSEEEVKQLINQYKEYFSIYRNIQILNVEFEEWFEQFKKKA